MKKQLVITDLTRMQRGRVCVAGYDKDGQCIRPVLPPPGINEQSLAADGKPMIFPFAIVEYDLLEHTPQPPHTEDHRYDPAAVRFIRRVADQNRARVFEWSLFDTVSAIFEQPIQEDPGYYVMDGRGPRSLGTIRPQAILKAVYEPGPEGTWDYRLAFVDGETVLYRLKIVDLTWHYYCDSHRGADRAPDRIATDLTTKLKSSTVYLRIGLSRGWAKFPERCYLQITAIHTLPDYLEGKTFADFAPK
jgi:hypothetical protein